MGQFLVAPANVPFAIALGIMLALGTIEVLTMLFGASASDSLDSAVEGGADPGPSTGGEVSVLGWLYFGKVPVLIWLALAASGFGLTGYAVQAISINFTGALQSAWVASAIAILGMILSVRTFGGFLRRSLLKEHTDAVHGDDLVGRLATITLGTTTLGEPTQAKLQDEHRTNHYVLVEPLLEGYSYSLGDEVVLIERHGALYRVIGRDEDIDRVTERLSMK